MRAARSKLIAVGFFGGAAAGSLAWSRMQRRYRRELFSRHALWRAAALSYLRSRETVETARLLREYIAWERQPLLRRKGARILRRVELSLQGK